MERKKELPILGHIFKKIAPQIGASVFVEPIWGVVGQITFKNGKRSYFRYNTLDLNPMGASEIARDKDYANLFMASLGYPTVPHSKTFFSKEWGEAIGMPERGIDAAYAHAKKIGLPVIVKPNSRSQGTAVCLAHTKRDFYSAMRRVFRADRVGIVETPVSGKDYRIVVLDDRVISAYQRIPLCVVGDGVSTIAELLDKKQDDFARLKRDTTIRKDDPRIAAKLKRLKLSFGSILPRGEKTYLLDNANLSTGGDSVEVTDRIHPDFERIAIRLTKDMGLRLCGVDLMIEGDISEKPKTYWVLEINSAPGLDHYARMGKEQERVVEDMYLEVLKHLEG